jgi:predicted nucleic acid-binding protein
MPNGRRSKSSEFVLDCSVTVAWFFEDEVDAYCNSVHDALAKRAAIVPALWPFEVANALLVGERRKRTTQAKSATFLSLLESLPIVVDDDSIRKALRDTWLMAGANSLTVYDASYLELAIRRRLPLATNDDRLSATAKATGVPIFAP